MITLKKKPDCWRILAYKYGEGEGGDSNFNGHATAIRYNESNQQIEFVDPDGNLVNHITEETKKGLRKYSWDEFDFGTKNRIFLFIYKNGLYEYNPPLTK
jgi:hypothetical protein